jgi:hypothetical protein
LSRFRDGAEVSNSNNNGTVALEIRDVVGEKKRSPTIAFYAAGIGVMFLLFTASAAGGSLLDEAESGALDRNLSSRVSMTTLLAGKMVLHLAGLRAAHTQCSFGAPPSFISICSRTCPASSS